MEISKWFDLGLIGHKSKSLSELFRGDFLVDVPMCIDYLDFCALNKNMYVLFIDYTLGGDGKTGTKVFTNAFQNETQFFTSLSNKLIQEYVKTNQSLDFKQNF